MISAQNIKLDNLIQELLYNEDCIIVPGFGAFVCNYQPAVIEENQKLILPPSKSISFNSQLIKNDGFLASKISEIFEVSYEDGNQIIASIVSDWNASLTHKKFLELDGVGSFRQNEFGKLLFNQFSEVNLLTDSFGLSPLPIELVKSVKKPAIVKELHANSKSYKTAFKYVAAASLLLPFIFGVFWMTINFNDYKNQIVGLDVFSFSEKNDTIESNTIDYSISKQNEIKTEQEVDAFFDEKEMVEAVEVIEVNKVSEATKNTVEQPLINTEAIAETKAAQEIPKETKSEVIVNSTQYKYAIIGGCFGSEENALNFQTELKNKGFESQIVGQSNSGLYQVAYSTHNSRVDALQALAKIRVDSTQKGWVLKR